jgi:hypothetical protein
MEGMANDMMMGNYKMAVALYHSVEEWVDAEEVLNGLSIAKPGSKEGEAAIAELLREKLQSRMRDLEAKTCHRLIAWEDERHYSLMGQDFDAHDRDLEHAL